MWHSPQSIIVMWSRYGLIDDILADGHEDEERSFRFSMDKRRVLSGELWIEGSEGEGSNFAWIRGNADSLVMIGGGSDIDMASPDCGSEFEYRTREEWARRSPHAREFPPFDESMPTWSFAVEADGATSPNWHDASGVDQELREMRTCLQVLGNQGKLRQYVISESRRVAIDRGLQPDDVFQALTPIVEGKKLLGEDLAAIACIKTKRPVIEIVQASGYNGVLDMF